MRVLEVVSRGTHVRNTRRCEQSCVWAECVERARKASRVDHGPQADPRFVPVKSRLFMLKHLTIATNKLSCPTNAAGFMPVQVLRG